MNMRTSGYVMAASLAVLSAGAFGETLVRSNATMSVEWNLANGGLKAVRLLTDCEQMNWVEGKRTWGELRAYRANRQRTLWNYYDFPYMEYDETVVQGAAVVSRYHLGDLRATVRRELKADGLDESYAFTNAGAAPLYFLRGQLGILATFNDSYGAAAVCERQRCNAHIFAHGEGAYVHALKMGPFPTDLVLSMTEGALDGYSVQRSVEEWSNDRGDFLLHPAPFTLRPGETKTFAWTLKPVAAETFRPSVQAKYETCFPGEEFEITDAQGVHHVKAPAGHIGPFEACGARLCVSEPKETLIRRRIDFIVNHQQCLDRQSPLYGAFLIYDNEDGRQYFDNFWNDHNASRERLGMGLLLARWLKTHDDAKVRQALDLYEQFVFREFLDEETGAVFDTIGKDPAFKRLYNAPWAVTFLSELYLLKRDPRYLDIMERAILDYYAKGGEKFYPNGCAFAEVIAMIRDAGRDVTALKAAHRRHIDTLLANGVNYPPHEVQFEQTIVCPALSLLENYWLYLEKDPKVRAAIDEHLAILRRFDGDQPDHLAGGVPIRHWDGYWFGKLHSYGDTLHYWSALSANAYVLYAKISGDDRWRERAERCFRNVLYLYRPDGTAACAYYRPYRMTMTDKDGNDQLAPVRGERHDPWANDQDFGLYFVLRNMEKR